MVKTQKRNLGALRVRIWFGGGGGSIRIAM